MGLCEESELDERYDTSKIELSKRELADESIKSALEKEFSAQIDLVVKQIHEYIGTLDSFNSSELKQFTDERDALIRVADTILVALDDLIPNQLASNKVKANLILMFLMKINMLRVTLKPDRLEKLRLDLKQMGYSIGSKA